MELLFYDFEVFKNDWLVVFKDVNKQVKGIYHNSTDGIKELIDGKVLVGYNNYHYDDIILTTVLAGAGVEKVKQTNDEIIAGNCNIKANLKNKTLDCMQQISVAPVGLKYIEGNMGRSIVESEVDFNLDRALTESELVETIKYCSYDVDTTIDVYMMREHNYFSTKEKLVELLGADNKKAMKWNTTTISAQLILDKKLHQWAGLRGIKEEWKNIVPFDVWQMWETEADVRTTEKNKEKSIKKDLFGCEIQFGFGGLHGAPKEPLKVKNVKMLDVASMYPNIILNIDVFGDKSPVYRGILNERLKIKHVDKLKSDALKLILNSAYGNLNNKYSMLFNSRAAMSVCVYGQIALFELCKRLYAVGCKLININTDGVGFTATDDRYKELVPAWEEEFGLKLEEDEFELFIQRDVNNYIGVKNGKFKCKGGDVKRFDKDFFFDNNSCRIIDIAIVNYLVNGVDPVDTIYDNLDKPELFQYILKAGSTFKGVYDNKGNKYQKYNRVFAAKDGDLVLKKMRQDGGLVMFPDTPPKMFVWNDECKELKDFEKIIDKNWYYQLINKKLQAWR